MKKIVETDLYVIWVDALKNRLYQEVRGKWIAPVANYHYEQDVEKALSLLKKNFTILNDALKAEGVMSAEWAAIAAKIRQRLVNHGMKASAELLPENVLTKMQVKRVSKETHFETRFFRDRKEAETWLDSL